jgi:nicotinamidase-related amidase
VVDNAKIVADRFRAARALVVLLHVGFADDYADAPRQPVDQPMQRPEGGLPANWSVLVDGIRQPGDVVIRKRQWGAFHGTDLDLQLRRRGIGTIVLGGIATNFGVESTARSAWEHGYAVQVAEDLCAGPSSEAHEFAFRVIFPRIAHVIESADARFDS